MQWHLCCSILLALIPATDGNSQRPQPASGIREYCESDTFAGRCAEDEVVVVGHGRYGRMREGRCITTDYGSMGCSSDVLGLLDSKCSGLPTCDVIVSKLVPADQQTCPKDFRSYLEANYSCVKVTTGKASMCRPNNHIRVTQPQGFLARSVTLETNLGSLDCPWLVEARPGQTIKITLYDFGWAEESSTDSVCHVYAIIKETAASTSETICAGSIRQNEVYSSVTNVVEIRLVANRKDKKPRNFLLKYQALGCGDPDQPKHGWSERKGAVATQGCNHNAEKWQLRCVGSKWHGHFVNCSEGLAGHSTGQSVLEGFTFSSGISILVIILIAVAIGVFILLFGLACLRRQIRTRASPPQNQEQYDPYRQPRESTLGGGQISKSAELLDPGFQGENNYSRTWQMHSHPYIPPAVNYSMDRGYNSRYVEHVYESPKFERKEFDLELAHGPSGEPVQYFELDPETGVAQNEGFNPRMNDPHLPPRNIPPPYKDVHVSCRPPLP